MSERLPEYIDPETALVLARQSMFACAQELDPNFGTYPNLVSHPPIRIPDEFSGTRTYEFYAACEEQVDISAGRPWLGARIGLAESWCTYEDAENLKPLFSDVYSLSLLDRLQGGIQVTLRWSYEVNHNPGIARRSEIVISDNRVSELYGRIDMQNGKFVPSEPQMRSMGDGSNRLWYSARAERRRLRALDASLDVARINDILLFLGWAQHRVMIRNPDNT